MTRRDTSAALDFLSSLTEIKGFGPKRVEALREGGIETVGDLLYHLPRRYLDRSRIVPIGSAGDHLSATCTVSGEIERARFGRGRRSSFRVLLRDTTGSIELIWFAGLSAYRSFLKPGAKLLVTGRVSRYTRLQMVHPLVEFLNEGAANGHAPYVPFYPLSDTMREAGLSNRLVSKAVRWALDAVGRYPRLLPEPIEVKRGFPPLDICLREIHTPSDPVKLAAAKDRLRYEELYKLALELRWNRRAFARPGRCLHRGDLAERFRGELPFRLTGDQEEAIRILERDAVSDRRMHRLLQGDVGSGKTLVAFFACFPALASGLQVAWLAPTEILARQTHRLIASWLSKLGYKADLLAAGIVPARKRSLLDGLARGEVRFVVGTHALLMPSVKFQRLGMIVIDEQHKFGASQRLALQEKDAASDFLLMSATPIPQTLAQTLYGDLEIVTIRKPPAGRLPVATHLVTAGKRADMEKFVHREIVERGAAVYYVVPRIEPDDEAGTLKDAETTFLELKKGVLGGIPSACLHGRMNSDEKERVTRSFASGEIRLLVSTTMVEVGIDIPWARVMVIENAERFGLAQLHQLRGRVGRGGEKSYCFLLTSPQIDGQVLDRLSFFRGTHDGFKIAELDLELRGPGEVAGFRQTGWDDLKVADIVRDARLFGEIREEIEATLSG